LLNMTVLSNILKQNNDTVIFVHDFYNTYLWR
jgi:hypothetical protein